MTARDRVLTAISQLDACEVEILALVAERLAMGRRAYGVLRPETDPRDFAREALEEAADGLVYVAAALVRSGRPWGPVEAPAGRQCGAERTG